MQHKKIFFVVFLRVKKKWCLKGNFPKKNILKKETKERWFYVFLILFSFYPFFCFFNARSTRTSWPGRVDFVGVDPIESTQNKPKERNQEQNKSKVEKTQKLEKFSIKNGSKQKRQNKTDECSLSPHKIWFSIHSRFWTKKGMFLFVILHRSRIKGPFLLMTKRITRFCPKRILIWNQNPETGKI